MVQTFKIKKGDTKPVLETTLQYSNGSAIDLTDATEIFFHMGNITDYSAYSSGAAVITGSSAGTLEYQWNATNDTGSVGNYWGEFKVTFGAGSILTLPSDHDLKIEVYEDYE